jgi:hypothetical protein
MEAENESPEDRRKKMIDEFYEDGGDPLAGFLGKYRRNRTSAPDQDELQALREARTQDQWNR